MSQLLTVALFGEAERGDFQLPIACDTLAMLYEYFGNPPFESQGLLAAIEGILLGRKVIYVRVHEEGFSEKDYFCGLEKIEEIMKKERVDALFLPGVGDEKIINTASLLIAAYRSVLLTTEKDLYDYITSFS